MFSFIFPFCKSKKQKEETVKKEYQIVKHPEWTKTANIYEVNIRQFSPSGDFKGFAKHLPRLKAMGVDILWLMPIHPIGEKNRKGSKGSYYSVKDYLAVNPDYGTMEDFKELVKQVHAQGMYLILDWVANHTAWDNKLIEEHPDWFTKDSLGKIKSPVDDWSDVADLNYDNQDLRKYMIDALKFWIKEADIDGYRCDVAGMVPTDFWNDARAALDSVKPVFMLAEAEDTKLHEFAFDMTYAWELHFLLNSIAKGDTNVAKLDKYCKKEFKNYKTDYYRMQFTSNHDENSWKGTEYERMGKGAETFAVFCYTFPGMPLIYTGQETALNKRLKFFDVDSIKWGDYKLNNFYTTLNKLKKDNKALWNGAFGGNFLRLKTGADKAVFAFTRTKEDNSILTILNMSPKSQKISIKDSIPGGEYTNIFTNIKSKIDRKLSLNLKPWEYIVLKK